MRRSLDWLDISHSPSDGERVALDMAASVELAHQSCVVGDAEALLAWLHTHGGAPDEAGEGLARWSVDDQRYTRNGRFELAIALDLDAELYAHMQDQFDLGLQD